MRSDMDKTTKKKSAVTTAENKQIAILQAQVNESRGELSQARNDAQLVRNSIRLSLERERAEAEAMLASIRERLAIIGCEFGEGSPAIFKGRNW